MKFLLVLEKKRVLTRMNLAVLDWILGENFKDKIHTNLKKITIRT